MLDYKLCDNYDTLTYVVTILALLFQMVGDFVTLPYLRIQILESTTFLKSQLQIFSVSAFVVKYRIHTSKIYTPTNKTIQNIT